MYVAYEGLSDLGNGPNKPTATIILGEYSASLQDGALILSLVRAKNSGSDKNLATSFWQHIIDSDMFLVCMLLVKGCQTLAMDPTSLLQQSLGNTVPHCKMGTDIESSVSCKL